MRKNNFVLAIIAIVIISGVLISCSKEYESDQQQVKNNLVLDFYDKIGVIHNDGLNFIIDELYNTNITKTKALELRTVDIIKLAQKANVAFFNELEPSDSKAHDRGEYLINSIYDKVSSDSKLLKTRSSVDRAINIDKFLSENQKKTINELYDIMLNKNLDLEGTVNKIKILEERILNEFDENEYHTLLATTAGAKHSLQYWSDNINLWRFKLGGQTQRIMTRSESNPDDFSWKQLGVVDAAGAATTGGITWLCGLGPDGWVAWSAIVGGTAVGASISDTIIQIWL